MSSGGLKNVNILLFKYLSTRNIEYHIFGTFIQQIMLLIIGYLTFYFEITDFNVSSFYRKLKKLLINNSGQDHGELDPDVGDCHHSLRHSDESSCHSLSQDDRCLALHCHQHDGLPPHVPHLPRVHYQEGDQQQHQHPGHLLHEEELQVGRHVRHTNKVDKAINIL